MEPNANADPRHDAATTPPRRPPDRCRSSTTALMPDRPPFVRDQTLSDALRSLEAAGRLCHAPLTAGGCPPPPSRFPFPVP